MQSQIARKASYLEIKFVKKKKMGHVFSPVYQPRQYEYGCIHIIHTITRNIT